MVRPQKRDPGILLVGIVFLIAGVLTLQTGEAGWYGVVGISGSQARLFGGASLVFAGVILWLYIRKPRSQ